MCLIYASMVLAWYHLSVVVVRLFSILYVFVLLFSLHACAFTVYRTVVVQKRGEKNYPALCTRHISVEVKLWIRAHGLMTKKCMLPNYNSRLGRISKACSTKKWHTSSQDQKVFVSHTYYQTSLEKRRNRKKVICVCQKPGLVNNSILFCWLFTIKDYWKSVF